MLVPARNVDHFGQQGEQHGGEAATKLYCVQAQLTFDVLADRPDAVLAIQAHQKTTATGHLHELYVVDDVVVQGTGLRQTVIEGYRLAEDVLHVFLHGNSLLYLVLQEHARPFLVVAQYANRREVVQHIPHLYHLVGPFISNKPLPMNR